MSNNEITTKTVKPKLGLLGATVNAMALIAPGAFLWITFQLQAAATAPNGASVASDIWAGIVLALIVAMLTALAYAELARIYPEAGFASCVYFAERAFLDSRKEKESGPKSIARIAKIVTGWSAHLFYWVYPGVMVAMMATLVGYIYTQFTGAALSVSTLTLFCIIFSAVTGYIAYRGITGSTTTALWINIIQWAALVIFSGLAIWYRISNPQVAAQWSFSGAIDVIKPHSFNGVLIQSTIAILILVGFESCTALASETENPQNTLPKAIILSLVIQGLFAYLLEYLAAGYMVNEKLTVLVNGTTLTGMAAAAASSAPIGDLTKILGNSLFNGIGFGLMITMALTVAIAIIGTTLSCMNTAIRVTAGMADDRELPKDFSFLHAETGVPYMTLAVLIIATSIIAAVGIRSVVGLVGITLASNFGTFVLYGLTCIWTIVAFKDRKDFSVVKHVIVPVLGVITNVIMLAAIIYLYSIGNADSKAEAQICFVIAGAWALITVLYVAVTTVRKTNRLKMVSCMIRPDYLNLVVEVLKEEDFIMGMTVTKVKGFGRQKGKADGDPGSDTINFLPKIRIDVVVKEWDVPKIMDIISEAARTGNIGDGKIFVTDASEVMRIRTGEMGVKAI
ncbi:MAG: amino acid permease [bacterium]|nr:amino acid permease [bacterium]